MEASELRERTCYRSQAGGEYYITSISDFVHFRFRGLEGLFSGPPDAFASVMKRVDMPAKAWWS